MGTHLSLGPVTLSPCHLCSHLQQSCKTLSCYYCCRVHLHEWRKQLQCVAIVHSSFPIRWTNEVLFVSCLHYINAVVSSSIQTSQIIDFTSGNVAATLVNPSLELVTVLAKLTETATTVLELLLCQLRQSYFARLVLQTHTRAVPSVC